MQGEKEAERDKNGGENHAAGKCGFSQVSAKYLANPHKIRLHTLTFNQGVAGSNPACFKPKKNAGKPYSSRLPALFVLFPFALVCIRLVSAK